MPSPDPMFVSDRLLRTHPLPDQYIMDEIDLYSLRDLVEANNRALTNDLQKKYSAYLEHCRLCQVRERLGCSVTSLGDVVL